MALGYFSASRKMYEPCNNALRSNNLQNQDNLARATTEIN